MNELTIISRKSTLAKLQAIEVSEMIKRKFPELKINFKTKDTSGDTVVCPAFTLLYMTFW